MQTAPEELVGGGRAAAPAVDATVSRVLTKGEPVAAPGGRADDFSWPRGSARNAQPAAADPAAAPPATPATATAPDAPDAKPTKPAAGARTSDSSEANPTSEQKPAQRRPRARPNPWNAQRSPFFFQNFFR